MAKVAQFFKLLLSIQIMLITFKWELYHDW